eukprot:TRINITY_DN18445_c0_g3_i2.p1 TRINITY_DN18445_c0_g3~~TRINITY_DN18445_c0_g3_i2.p1  ORF type:complete len:252 (+),score=54.81 TRINITY_DN18445_c0_g3_i2:74-829(+)
MFFDESEAVERTYCFNIPADGNKDARQLHLKIFGWPLVGGDVIWRGAKLLAEELARKGTRNLQGQKVLELGSGIGILAAVAAKLGAKAIATDGDEGAIPILALNSERFLDDESSGGALFSAYLEWGTDAASEAHEAAEKDTSGLPLRRGSFDLILGSEIVYMPRFIPQLAETIAFFLSDSGEAIIANTAVATNTTQPEAKALFLSSLEKAGLVVQEERPPDGPAFLKAEDPSLYEVESAYLLRISHPRKTT